MKLPRILTSLLIIPVLLIVTAVFAGEPDKKRLQGVWVVQTAQIGGKPFDRLKLATLRFKGDVAIMKSKLPGGREDVDENPFELNESAKPKRITLFQKKNRDQGVQRGIYELRRDLLRICISAPGAKGFPQNFSGKNCLLLTLKRKTN